MAADLGRDRGCWRLPVHSWDLRHASLPRERKALLPGRCLEDGATQPIASQWHLRPCSGSPIRGGRARAGPTTLLVCVCVRDDVRRLETGALASEVFFSQERLGALPGVLPFKISPRGRNETLIGLDKN